MQVLIIRLSSLGDVILATAPAYELWKRGIKVDFLTYRGNGEILKGQPFIRRVIEIEKELLSFRRIGEIKEFVASLGKYDAVFDIHSVGKTKLLKLFLKGFPVYTYRKMSFLRRVMTVFKPFKASWLYVPELYCEPLKKIGIEAKEPRPYLEVREETLRRVRKLLPSGKRGVVALGVGAKHEGKIYPEENFKEVAKILISKGYGVFTLGGEEDRDRGEKLQEVGVKNLCGELSLTESLAAVKLASIVISNDSAVAHMARAVKTPVITLFGPTHPAFGFAPKKDEGEAMTLNLPCSPCSLHGKARCSQRRCLKELSPQGVAETALGRLER